MTEMVNGDSQGFSNTPAMPQAAPAPVSSGESEKTFRQSEVNELIGRAKSEAIERYKRESSMASHVPPPQQNQQYGQQYGQPQPYQNPALSEDHFRKIAAEEAKRARQEMIEEARRSSQEQDANRIANEFFQKVGAGEGGMQEFEKAVTDAGLDIRTIPYHVQLANMVDNTREVMLDLVKNPSKLGEIQNLIDIDLRAGRQPNLALSAMRRISESIKRNSEAANYQSPNEPLGNLRPSNAGAGVKGPLSAADYKRRYKV